MIWARRVAVAPLILALLLLTSLSMIVVQLSNGFLNAEFYARHLKTANFYEFMLTEVATATLDDVKEMEIGDLIANLELSTPDFVTSLNRAVPPRWIQTQAEHILDQTIGYVSGQSDNMSITIEVKKQIQPIISEIEVLALQSDIHKVVFEEIIMPSVRESVTEKLPLGLEINETQLVESIHRVITEDWLQAQIESAIHEVAPFIVGNKDTFTITIDFTDRVDLALVEIKDLLRESNAYSLLYEEVIAPHIAASMIENVILPAGFVISHQEVVNAMRNAAPPEWVHAQAERIIDETGSYIAGVKDNLIIEIPISENKITARAVILEKFREHLGNPDQNHYIYSQIEAVIDERVLRLIPDTIKFTEAQLNQNLVSAGAGHNLELIQSIRDMVSDGWQYTNVNLENDLNHEFGPSSVEELRNIREYIANGWDYTDQNFREDLSILGGTRATAYLDNSRSTFNWVNRLKYLMYIPVAALVILIGLLGGRRWTGRIVWGSTSLVLVSAVILAASLSINHLVTEPRLQDVQNSLISSTDINNDFQAATRMSIEKITDVAESMAKEFVSGVVSQSIIILLIGLSALITTLSLPVILKVLGNRRGPPV